MFDYETHQYLDDSNSPQYAGGLRLKSIESNGGGDSPPTVKTYKYGVDESGYGVPNFSMSKSFYQVESQIRQIRTFQPPITRTTFRIRTIISNSALSMDAYDGSTVVYPYVTEYHGTPESNIGKVVYQYDNGGYQPDGYRVVPLSSKVFKDTYFWARGKLTLKSVYDANANLTKTTQLAYFGSHYENRTIGHGAFQYVYYTLDRVGFLNQCTTPSNELVDAMEYQNAPFSQSTGSTREAIVTETTYDAGNANKSVVSITSKAYHPDYLQVTEMKSSKSNNFEEYVQKIKYPFSYANNPNATGNPIGSYSALNTLLQSNILSQPVEELSLVRKTDGSNERVTAGKYSTFKINPSNASQIVPDQIFLLETNAAIPSAAFKETNLNNVMLVDERYKARITFGEYDSDGNLLDVSKSDDNHLVYIWGYNNAIPIAEVVNASRKNVFHTSFEEDNTGIVSNDAKTGVKSKQAGYTLNLSNLDPGNYVLTYYQKNNGVWEQQLVNITVGNAGTYNTTFNTQIDEVRFYPVNAMMTTYTHEPLVGITSVTDVNGMTTYYVYDDFMRLILIRDNDANIVKSFNYNYFKP
jgi:YD repeat-containing protein